jgi:hypothetical protein
MMMRRRIKAVRSGGVIGVLKGERKCVKGEMLRNI